MLKDKDCTVFLALSGAVVPAGMRTIVADLIRNHLVDVIVSTGACMVHDAIEAVGGHHYIGGWAVNDSELYNYHLFRIYDIFVPEEDYVRLDFKLSEMYDDIAAEHKGESLSIKRVYMGNRQTINRQKLHPTRSLRRKRSHLSPSRAGFRIWLHPLASFIPGKTKTRASIGRLQRCANHLQHLRKIAQKRHDSYRRRSTTQYHPILRIGV